MPENYTIPTFAIVGKVNMGKTSVLSTLLEQDNNEILSVSPTPGETKECHDHYLTINDQKLVRFIDTPGFQRPIECMLAIKKFHGNKGTSPGRTAIQHFVTHYKDTDEFSDEVHLLAPILEGAGLVYIIDTSHPIRDTYRAEMEIFQWSGCQRLAIVNNQNQQESSLEWKHILGKYFNLVRTFNAHSATYEERHKLLRNLLEIDESQEVAIKRTIDAINLEWQQRREIAAQIICDFLRFSLQHHQSVSISRRDCENANRREKSVRELKKAYFQSIRKLQNKSFKQLLKLYRHNLIDIKETESYIHGIDLEAAETWSKWGLSRGQLSIAGGITGAAAGGALDIATGGFTMGIGTGVGSIVGFTATYFKGGSLPNFNIASEYLKTKNASGNNEQRKLTIKSPEDENFPWILLDSIILQYRAMLQRAHGRRDIENVAVPMAEESFVRKLSTAQRSLMSKWLVSCKKGNPDFALEPKALEAIECLLDIKFSEE